MWGRGVAYPWGDEGVSYVTIQRTWPQLFELWNGRDAPLLGYYVVAKAWSDTVMALTSQSISIEIVRASSALLCAVAVLMCFLLTSRYLGQIVGTLCAVVLMLLPGMTRYAHEMRPAALAMAAVAVAWWAFDRWAFPDGRDSPWKRRGIAVVMVAALVTIPFASLFGMLQWITIGIIAVGNIVSRIARRPTRRPVRSDLQVLVPLVVASIIAVVPSVHIAAHGAGPQRSSPPTLERLTRTLLDVPFGADPEAAGWLIALFITLVFASLFWLRDAKMRHFIGMVWLWLLVPLLGGLAAGIIHPAFVRQRYWMPLILPAAVLCSLGIAGVVCFLQSRLPQRIAKPYAITLSALLLIALGVGTAPATLVTRSPAGHGANMAPVLQQVRAWQREYPDAKILIDGVGASFYFASPAPDLYRENFLLYPKPNHFDVWPGVIEPEERSSEMKAADSLIWLHYWKTKPAKRLKDLGTELDDAGLTQRDHERLSDLWEASLYVRE